MGDRIRTSETHRVGAGRDRTRRPPTRDGSHPGLRPRMALRSPEDVLSLQALAGNRAVSRLLSASPSVAPVDHPAEQRAEASPSGFTRSEAARSGGGRHASPLASGPGRELGADAGRRLGMSAEQLESVRLHTGPESDELNEALGSEGFSHGSDIFLSSEHYRPGTAAGDGLLAHEVSHAAGSPAGTGQLFMKRTKKHLDFLRFKRKETHIARMLASMALSKIGADKLADKVSTDSDGDQYDHYGHWWVEAGSLRDPADLSSWNPVESWGWWPAHGVGIAETLKITRVEGLLNQGDANDPHHGDKADTEFHPVMEVEDSEPYEAIRDRVLGKVREFATSFKGSWNWRLAWGKNCHTFQDRMKKKLDLHHQNVKAWLTGAGLQKAEPTPRKLSEIITELDDLNMIGGGYGMLNAMSAIIRGKFSQAEIAALTDDEKRQLVAAINRNQEGWNRARASDVNEFFTAATGEPTNLFNSTHETADVPKVPSTPPVLTTSTESTAPTTEVSDQPTVSVPPPQPALDRDRLMGLAKTVQTVTKGLVTGSAYVKPGEEVYVTQVTDDQVQFERSRFEGGGRFWVDAAAFMAALDDDSSGVGRPRSDSVNSGETSEPSGSRRSSRRMSVSS